MDNSVQRGGRMLGKLYGSNRPPPSDWRFEASRMLDSSRAFKDPQIQGNSRQHGDFRMQESRLLLESRIESNYSPPRMSDVSEMQGNERIPERVRGGPQLQREVRAHPESRIHSSHRVQGNSRIYEDLPLHDQQRSRSNAVAYDYNHQRSDERSPLKDTSVPPNFIMNSNENIRSGRSVYNVQDDNMRQGVYDALPGLPSDSAGKKNIGLLPPKSYGPLSGIPPGSGHILTPSLTSSGPQTVDGIRSVGNRSSYPKEKSSKAFDYLKNWRLKMNLPTDTFLLEKDGAVGNQGHDIMAPHAHDDWYTQPPTAEPRVGRASIDPEWNSSGNSFAEKDGYVERPSNKYGEARYGVYNEPAAAYPRDQILESDRTSNQPWKWDEEAPNIQNQGAKRSYESMSSGQDFSSAHRDSHYLEDEMLQSKRSRLSPSRMQDNREAVEHYAPVASQQGLSQNNLSYNDNAKFQMNANEPFYEPHNEWKTSFHRRPSLNSNKFRQSRSPQDTRSESIGSRNKLFPGEMKGVMAREGSQPSYSQSREVRNLSHNVAHSQRSPEPLGRDRYPESHLQDRAPRLIDHGRSPDLNQNPVNQGRPPPPPNEMFMASDHYSLDVSPRLYPRLRSNRSPVKVKSPGPGMRGRLPPFSHSKSPPVASRVRDRSSPWRKGKSPGLGRGRPLGPERERSPAHVGRVSPRAVGKGRSSGPGGRGGLSRPSGKQRSPVAQRIPGPPRRDRSPEVARRGKSPGPLGRMRSPVSPRRRMSPGPQGRERSSPGPPGRGRSLDRGRWKSSGRPLDHSGRGKSPELHGRDRPLGSSGRGKSPIFVGKGRSPIHAGMGRSPGPPRGPTSGSLDRGRSPGKSHSHSGRRVTQGSLERGKLLPESSGRGSSPGAGRARSSGTSGRSRLPGATARDRSPGFHGRGKQTGASDRGRSPKLHITGKPSKPIEGSSHGLVPHHSSEFQEQLRSGSPGAQRRSAKGQTNSPNHPPRGRSPMKGKSYGGARTRSDSFSQTKTRSVVKERSERLGSRSARSPVKRLAPGHREKGENLIGQEYGEYNNKMERSPYFEEISVSPRFWSPTRKGAMNISSQRGRERSRSVDGLQRGCSPVSPQTGGYSGHNLHPQEPFIPEREDHMQQDRATRFYRECSPISVDGYAAVGKGNLEIEMKSHGGSQRERFYSPSREVSFGAGRSSVEKSHSTKGNWREHEKDRVSQHYHGKKGAGDKVSDPKDVKKVSGSKFSEADVRGGTLSEEEVDDEDLRIHLLRLREQKVEMKLMKLEEESKETELKLWELKKNRTTPRGESPGNERRLSEKESFQPRGRRQEPHSWKNQRLPSPEQERYHRQHRRF